MPYTPPATSPALPPTSTAIYRVWPSSTTTSLTIDYLKKKQLSSPYADLVGDDKENANIKELKDILSTSQLSTSPRRKSAPESYSRKPSLKVDLPSSSLLQQEMPCLIRKKSGEIVKPSLKKGLSKSAPVTPTFPKYVHFNADLEQIRLFNEAQKPQAVSAEVSDEETDDDDDDEFDFSVSEDDDDDDEDLDQEPELNISLPNIPIITTLHSSKPVFVESIFLSQDKRKLQGRIMVQNIAFQKKVDVRYTFDFWSTVSEVSAGFAEGVPTKDNKNSFDVFVFSIELIDNSRNPIDGKTMYFAVHYHVEDRDFWDNNNGSNYQVNFKRITRPSSSITKKKISNQSSQISSWSMTSIPKPPTKTLDDLCRSPPTLGLSPNFFTTMADSRKKLLGRYDIGVSLSAAQNAQRSNITTTRTYQPFISSQVSYGGESAAQNAQRSNITTRTCQPFISSQVSYGGDNFQSYFPNNYVDGMPMSSSSDFGNSNPITIPSSKPIIGSSSYHDLVNQYCFYSGSPTTITTS
jgi:hypothetical protein